MPHHGSDNNVTADFFNSIVADTYVLSGDGKHGNPERTTVEWLIASRHPSDQYTVVLTYTIADVDVRREQHARQHNQPWTYHTNALAPMIEQCRQDGHLFTLVDGTPFKIDLGEDLVEW